jgi:hypothetical protein
VNTRSFGGGGQNIGLAACAASGLSRSASFRLLASNSGKSKTPLMA